MSSPFLLFLAWRPSWLEVGNTGHNFGRGPSKDHFRKVACSRHDTAAKIVIKQLLTHYIQHQRNQVVDTIFQIQKLLQLLSMAHGSMTLK
jgi:hypothetical protein